MAFKRFVKKGRSFKPKVSIWSRGQIGFNQGAVNKYNLDKYDYAILFHDEETNRIGVKFTSDDTEEGIVKLTKRAGGLSFSAQAFLDSIEYNYSKTKKYDFEIDEQERLFIVQL